MIALFEGAPPEDFAMACRMETLARCYGDIPNGAGLYKSGGGGYLCRFGGLLLASGGCAPAELGRFAEALGVSRIELEAEAPPQIEGWRPVCRPLLYRGCGGEAEIPLLPSLEQCYGVIAAADSGFAGGSEYLYWLSDITRRQNMGRGKAYCSGGAAAVVSAIGEKTAWLSSVAVLPDMRGQGRASRLLGRIFSDQLLCGKRLFTVAQNGRLIPFYQKQGFSPCYKMIITYDKELR